MDPFDEIVISNYLSLSEITQKLSKRKYELRLEFYSQNMATHTDYLPISKDQYEMIVKGFRPDKEVEKLILNIEKIDHRMDRCLFRKKHFDSFFKKLDHVEQLIVIEKFKKGKSIICPQNLIDRILDEIAEIETAICFREGVEPDISETEVLVDAETNLERMCDFFAI